MLQPAAAGPHLLEEHPERAAPPPLLAPDVGGPELPAHAAAPQPAWGHVAYSIQFRGLELPINQNISFPQAQGTRSNYIYSTTELHLEKRYLCRSVWLVEDEAQGSMWARSQSMWSCGQSEVSIWSRDLAPTNHSSPGSGRCAAAPAPSRGSRCGHRSADTWPAAPPPSPARRAWHHRAPGPA